MSLFVPQGIGEVVGATLLLVDYPDDFTDHAVVGADGTAAFATSPVEPGQYWRVERLTTVVTDQSGNLVATPAGAVLMVYKGTQLVATAFRDGSQSPGLDVADMSQPITLRPGESLTFAYSGLAVGTIANATAQYSLYLRVVGA